MRTCSRCKESKPLDDYYAQRRRGTVGHQRICKACSREYLREWGKRNPDAIKRADRKKTLKARYGISIEQYDAILKAQNGGCGVCGRPERTVQRAGSPIQNLAVDHDHETKRIRGLLCQPCNRALGNMGDSLEGVMRFVDYLRHSG
jgi:hypothetical protein